MIALRLAILPLFPIPLPFCPDDFSFLLAATRLRTAGWPIQRPRCGRILKASTSRCSRPTSRCIFRARACFWLPARSLFGRSVDRIVDCERADVRGSLLDAAGMAAARIGRCWAACIAVLRLGVFSYWTNTYHAAGSLGALGGALILGGLPRLMKTARIRYATLMGIGIAILVLTRPYEGVLLCLPVGFVLGRWMWKGKNRPSPASAGAPGRRTAGVWHCGGCVDGLLRLSRIRKPTDSAIHGRPQHVRYCSLLCVAARTA